MKTKLIRGLLISRTVSIISCESAKTNFSSISKPLH